MPDKRLPKKILYGELPVGKRSHGGQKKQYKDTPKASLKDFSIPTKSWEQTAQDRTKWRGLIKRGAGEYEAKRISEAEQKRAQRKARAKASLSRISHEYSSLFIIVINLIFMFLLWCIDWVGSLYANLIFMCFCIKSSIGTQGEVS